MTGVMSGESAAGTMETVAIAGAKRRGVEPDMAALAKQRAAIEAIFGGQEDAFFTSGRLLDNGIIDPRNTRKVIGFTLETIWERKHRKVQPNAFGIGRM
jgi:geranyl-CoA carboxylase beta subunit